MSEHMALENLTVLDLTRVLAGPFCTMMLADMGANVIKIEVPKGGDDTRSYPPFRAKNLNGERESVYFANSGYRGGKLPPRRDGQAGAGL